MSKKGIPFEVNTEPDKGYLVNGSTKDATIEACLYDLIDNSIDAATEKIRRTDPTNILDDLPFSYDGYQISIKISGSKFSIEDNASGIAVTTFRDLALRFGRESSHDTGIGRFGVGLNRALFKIGVVSKIETDTGTERSVLDLDATKYILSDKTSCTKISIYREFRNNYHDYKTTQRSCA